jgi:hypothetical protein
MCTLVRVLVCYAFTRSCFARRAGSHGYAVFGLFFVNGIKTGARGAAALGAMKGVESIVVYLCS